MPVSVYEKWASRELTLGENPSAELLYVIRGTNSNTDAYVAAKAVSPVTYAGLFRQSIHVVRIADDAWDATVSYGQRQRSEGESTYQFDTTGATQRITQSLRTVGTYAPSGKTPPNYGGAIGVTRDSVEGVDVTIPQYSFSETHQLPDWQVTPWYKSNLFMLTGTVNGAMFRGFQPGEVLFLGASGSKKGMDAWELTFRFAASPNVSGLVVGNIAGIAKRGWDYLWVRYADEEDPNANALVKRPQAVYVEQVYRVGNFLLLGIGV